MVSKKIFAFSSSRSADSAFLEIPSRVIGEFMGSAGADIAFIPFADAGYNYDEYTLAVERGLNNPALKIKTALPADAVSVIENCDAILVGGGNTFKLIHDLYEMKLLGLIFGKVNQGCPYIGWSAGSNILAPTISTTNDMPIIEPKSFKALGLIPFQINPHYHNHHIAGFNGETRDDRLIEFVKLNPEIPVVGLTEGSYLKLENETLQYFGAKEGVLFTSAMNKEGFNKKQINNIQDITFLL